MSKILLVEDSQTVVKVVSLVLKKASHKITICDSLKKIKENLSKNFDLIIFDYGMYDQSLKNIFLSPVIFTYTSYDDIVKIDDVPFVSARLVKPFTSEQLLDTVEKVLKQEQNNTNTWSMDNFEDPEIPQILTQDESQDEENKEIKMTENKKEDIKNETKQESFEDREERTEVTDIVSKSLTDNILNDIYGFEEQSEVKSLDEDNPILENINDGELSKDEQEKLLAEYELEQDKDGTIEFKDANNESTKIDEIKENENLDSEKEFISDKLEEKSIETEELSDINIPIAAIDTDTNSSVDNTENKIESEEISEEIETNTDIKQETVEEKIIEEEKDFELETEKEAEINTPEETITDLEQEEKQESNTFVQKLESESQVESEIETEPVAEVAETVAESETEPKAESLNIKEELRAVLKEVLPDLLAEALESKNVIEDLKKITMETAENIVREEINKIAKDED